MKFVPDSVLPLAVTFSVALELTARVILIAADEYNHNNDSRAEFGRVKLTTKMLRSLQSSVEEICGTLLVPVGFQRESELHGSGFEPGWVSFSDRSLTRRETPVVRNKILRLDKERGDLTLA